MIKKTHYFSVCGKVASDNEATFYINGNEFITVNIPPQEFCHPVPFPFEIQTIAIR